MDTVLSVGVVAAYVLLLTFVAVRARAAREFEEFSLAKRALPLALVFGSLAATYVGPGFTIGFVGRGFKSGFLFFAIGLAYAAQNVLVGLFVAPRLRALKNCHTLGDAIGQKYDRKCHILAGVISVGICTFLAAVMAYAGGIVVLSDIFGLPGWSSVMIVVGVTTLYTTFGGLRASVITDAFQFTAFAILMPVMLLFVLMFHFNGATNFASQASIATRDGFGSMTFIKGIGLVAAFLLGETLIPPYANRALASRTTGISRNGFILAGVFSVIWFMVMISLGITARGIIANDTAEDFVLLSLVKSIIPAGGYTLLLVVLISVVMSSFDSLLNAGAVAFTQDIVKPFKKLPDSASLNVGRAATIVIAAIAAVGAVFVPSIIDGLLTCYSIWAGILPALIIGLWIKKPSPLGGILSMGVGTVIAVTFEFIFPDFVEIPTIILALGSALLAYLLGHWIESNKTESGSKR